MTYAWRIAGAILAMASITFSTVSAASQFTTSKKGRISNKTIELIITGDEYRKSPNYPKDNADKGFDANAKSNYLSRCADLKNRLRIHLHSMLLGFRCAKGSNVAVQTTRRQYQGIVTIKIDHGHILFEKGDKIESPLIKANDYSSAKFKWHESRAEARKAYKKACVDYTEQLIQNDPNHILLVDCGVANEGSSKVGWRYSSTATVYKIIGELDPKACGKNKIHNDSWWVVDADYPIRSDFACRFGGRKEKLYERVIEIQCQNGQEVVTGAEKIGSFIRTVGSCLSPTNCGSKNHNSTWWEQDGYTRESAQCRYGGDRVDVYERLHKYSCYNGSISTTGSTKKGSHIHTEGQCNKLALEKRNCSGHAHGETWQERNVTQRDTKSCGRGGTKVVTKVQIIRYRCNDGNIVEKNRDTGTDETECRGQRRDDDDDRAKRERERREREKAERERRQLDRQAERERRKQEKAERNRQQRDREKAERERQKRDRQAERELRKREKAERNRQQRDREKAERERQQRDRQAERKRREREKAERDRQQRDREIAERERIQREQEAERKRKKAERERQ